MRKMTEKEATRFFNLWYNDPEFVEEREDLRRRYTEAYDKELNKLVKKYKKKHLNDFQQK